MSLNTFTISPRLTATFSQNTASAMNLGLQASAIFAMRGAASAM